MPVRSTARIASGFAPLLWLTEPGHDVPDDCRPIMLAELVSSRAAVMLGGFNGLVISLIGIERHGWSGFAALAALEGVILVARVMVLGRLHRARERESSPKIDLAIVLSIAWCALQGTVAFVSMWSADPVMMVLSATLVMAVIGPVCARNYAAPRLAILLVCLCAIPFAFGSLMSGIPALFLIAPMTPPLIAGSIQIVSRFHRIVVDVLTAEAQQRHLAWHDPLTGLLNRLGLDVALDGCVSPHIAILCIDLDNFKMVNDRHGHAAGDRLLETVGQRLMRHARESDLVARMGGDEFMIVLQGVTPQGAKRAADELIRTIAEVPVELPGGVMIAIGASVGYACLPDDADTIDDLRIRADAALYLAKNAGRGVGRRVGELALAS